MLSMLGQVTAKVEVEVNDKFGLKTTEFEEDDRKWKIMTLVVSIFK